VRRWALIAVLLFGALAAASAETSAQRAQKQALAQKQLQQTRAQIKALADQQRLLESQRSEAAIALRRIDNEVSDAQRKLRDTEARIAAQQAKLVRLQAQRLVLETALSNRRAELAALLRSAYALGTHAQLKLLLEQDRIGDLARALAYHRYFQQDRRQRIDSLRNELQALLQLDAQAQAGQTVLALAREQQKQALAALASKRQERSQTVSSLQARYRDRNARLVALGRDEKNTVALLERLRKLMEQTAKPTPARPVSPIPRTPGAAAIPIGPLRLPITGSVLAGYGGIMPDGHRSQGLLIAGTAGAEVHAVSAGRVAYADWLKGYGLLIILDHGNGWMSLYAFNDALLKNTGDSVRAGEAIATVGSSGGQGRPALYFELRHNGQPQDPRSWLKK
jgi:septal ring factor EnvC (AmiA/AmiB activator)